MSMSMGYAMHKRAGRCMAHGSADCGECYAKGGMVGEEKASGYQKMPEHDGLRDSGMVERIMHKRAGHKTVGDDTEVLADFESADYDAMDQRPEEHDADYTGANSGDELGDAAVEHDEAEDRDMVARIMKKRRQHNPRPA